MSDARRAAPHAARLPPQLDAAARNTVHRQEAVVTSAQLHAWGVGRAVVSRRVAHGDWQRLWRGVIALHSGAITWRERARGALLYAGDGAALSHSSAAFVHGIVSTPGPRIVVSIPAHRAVSPQPGLGLRRRRTMPHAGGRIRAVGVDATVLDLVHELDSEDDVVGLVCEAVRIGVLPGRLLLQAGGRRFLRHRDLVVNLLGDEGTGIESPLEHRYVRDVERRHRLPAACAQLRERTGGRWIRADRVHVGLGVRIELDGQLAHPSGRTARDTWRDNAVLIERSEITLRYRWQHVVAEPCETAAQVAAALRSRGWRGRAAPCSPTCSVLA
ncbi:hypothetical protein [Cellulomonas sp. Root137]|uniref:hypothetical protein n=1 Tax=Cellulomonas sp. Root137 TaxID=1736459 RepID=UPI0006F689DB|nr:hypothetical protein [Cellulomonas sp. Root137]KQY47367.1 hypothetical protein ASD18_08475 [Cellulomonas sp. Root137]